MIPELMFEVGCFFRGRIKLSHYIDNEFGGFCPAFPVINCAKVLYHLLHVSSIFGNDHLVTGGIIFHCVKFKQRYNLFGDSQPGELKQKLFLTYTREKHGSFFIWTNPFNTNHFPFTEAFMLNFHSCNDRLGIGRGNG